MAIEYHNKYRYHYIWTYKSKQIIIANKIWISEKKNNRGKRIVTNVLGQQILINSHVPSEVRVQFSYLFNTIFSKISILVLNCVNTDASTFQTL